jgi:hypothetical protein
MARRMGMVAGFLLAMVVVARGAEGPAVLKEVPETAQVVIVVRDIQGLADKVSSLATRLDLPVPQDLIGMITKNIGVKEGLDKGGSMAMVLLPGRTIAGMGEVGMVPPEPVLIIPTTDAKALLAGFKPGEEKDGISDVTMPNDPTEKGFVARREKFVALAMKREHLEHYLAMKGNITGKMTAETLAAINGNDISVYANVPELSKAYGETAKQYLKFVGNMMAPPPGRDGEMPVAMIVGKELSNLVFAAAGNFLEDAESSLLTVRLGDAGVTLGASGSFKKDSTWGKFIAAQKPNREVSLKGLPKFEEPLAAGSIYLDSSNITMMLTSLVERVTTNPSATLPGAKGDVEQTTKAMVIQKQMAEISSGGSFAVYTPADAKATGYLHAVFLIESTDAGKYVGLIAELAKMGSIDTAGSPIKVGVTVKENAETIGAVSVNRIKFTVNPLRDTAPASPAGLVNDIGGPNGITLTTAAVGKHAVLVLSSDRKLVAAAIEAAKKDSDELGASKEVAAVKGQVLANPSLVVYLPVDRWIAVAHLGKPAATGLALGLQPPVPTPVVMSANVTGQTVRFELFVPMTTLTSGVEAVKMQFGRMMFGG